MFKVILRSFQHQILSVWISIPKRAVSFHPNAFCYLCQDFFFFFFFWKLSVIQIFTSQAGKYEDVLYNTAEGLIDFSILNQKSVQDFRHALLFFR